MEQFYRKFYGDHHQRRMIIGINPGRFGAALSGVPFTDSARLAAPCGISYPGFKSYEVSSVFVYDVVAAFGGPEAFYRDVYIGSMCPRASPSKSPEVRKSTTTTTTASPSPRRFTDLWLRASANR